MNILIVDDNLINLKLLKLQLESEGHQAISALNGKDAIEIVKQDKIDFIISDILMPTLDGYRLCYELKSNKNFPVIPFVFYTSTYPDNSDRELALGLGADAFLHKPASIKELTGLIESFHDKKSTQKTKINLADTETFIKYNEKLQSRLENKNIELQKKKSQLSDEISIRLQTEDELKIQSSNFKQIFERSPMAITITTLDSNVLAVNKSFEQIFQYSEEELLGKKLIDIFKESESDSAEPFYGIMNKNPTQTRFLRKRKDGEWLTLIINSCTLDGVHKTNKMCIIYTDITEQVKLEKEKASAMEQLFHTSKLASIGTLATGVAHEINNPLSVISGSVELLLSDNTFSTESTLWLEKIAKASNRIKMIVDKMRVFARIDTKVEDELIDINAAILDTLSLIEILYFKEKIVVKKNFSLKKLQARGNSGKFQQILVNLLSNAKDAMINGGEITISTRDDNNSVITTITDTGTGISKDHLDKVFLPFFTTKEPGKGTGLGLSLSTSLIKEMDGRITIAKSDSTGTSFVITLPLVNGVEKETIRSEMVIQNKFGGKVLIVDDEEDICCVLSAYLQGFGFETHMAHDGVMALNKIKEHDYRIIITDLKMPLMSGHDLILEVLKLPKRKDTKIILNTGCISLDVNESLNETLALTDGFINKPFSRQDIYNTIKKVLNF